MKIEKNNTIRNVQFLCTYGWLVEDEGMFVKDVVVDDVNSSLLRGIGSVASFLFWSLELVVTKIGGSEGLVLICFGSFIGVLMIF